jgi:hypothetical protein
VPPTKITHDESPDRKPLGGWRRWLREGGTFLMLSLIVHGLLLLGAAVWVVQTVQAKRKLNFTGVPPPSNSGVKQLEYRVQTAKRTATMSPPPVSTRVVSTALDTKVALPEVALPPASSLATPGRMGALAGNPSAFKPAATPSATASQSTISAMSAGVTAFGFKMPQNAPANGLRGTLYYMRKHPDGTPYPEEPERAAYLQRIEALFGNKGKLNEAEAQKYLRFGQQLLANVILFPAMPGETGPKAFGVEQVPGAQQSWFAIYKAKVTSDNPKQRYRFVGGGNEVLIVRVDGKVVLDGSYDGLPWDSGKKRNPTGSGRRGDLGALWSNVRNTGDYFSFAPSGSELEVIIGEGWGGAFGADLCIEEDGKTYQGDQRPLFKIDGFQKALPQIQAALALPECARAMTLDGPTFKAR